MKIFKIKKETINLSHSEIIFKPNLPTQTILTDIRTHIDINELIKYFLIPNPRIYREIGDDFIKNYGMIWQFMFMFQSFINTTFMEYNTNTFKYFRIN